MFGSTVYVHDKTVKTKYENKSWVGILVGYHPNGYKIWHGKLHKYEFAKDVIVDENNYLNSRPEKEQNTQSSINDKKNELDDNIICNKNNMTTNSLR